MRHVVVVVFFFYPEAGAHPQPRERNSKEAVEVGSAGGNQSSESIRPESFMKAEVFRSQLCRQKEQLAAYTRRQRAAQGLNLPLIYLGPH